MSTTYTLVKVEPFLGGADATANNNQILEGTGQSTQGTLYKYVCHTNDATPKVITIISPDANLLTPGSNHLSGTNTGTIVITDTPG